MSGGRDLREAVWPAVAWLRLPSDEPDDRCTNPDGHEWNRSLAEADEARVSGDVANDNIRCIHCGADGDA